MLRIPGSHNSKCVFANNGTSDTTTEVRIIQKWDGNRPAINLVLRDFRRYLIQEKIYTELNSRKRRPGYYYSYNNKCVNKWPWIEALLKTPIGDYRKYAIWRIIAPYVVNVRKLSFEEAFHLMKDWLNRCCNIVPLDFNADQRIRDNLNAAIRVRYLPISFSDLKAQNKELHGLISNIGNGKHQKIRKI